MTLTSTVYLPTRPDLTITLLRGTSTSRGYHQSYYEIVSRTPLERADFERLDACNLLGFGQSYNLVSSETFTEAARSVIVDRETGLVLPDMVLDELTPPTTYTYHRYEIRRICDSGD